MTDFSTAGPEQRPLAPRDARSREFDQVQATVQALQGAASLLQGAMEQRQELVSEMRSAEESLALIQQQRAQAEQALANATSQLQRAAREVEQVRSEQNSVVAEFDKLVQGALARRGALVSEIAVLERQRDTLAQFRALTLAPAPVQTPPREIAPEPVLSTTPQKEPAMVLSLAPPVVPEPYLSATPPVAPEPPLRPAPPDLEWPPVVNAWLPVAQSASLPPPVTAAIESAQVDSAPRPWATSATPLARAAEQAPRQLHLEEFAPVPPAAPVLPAAPVAAEPRTAPPPPQAIFATEPRTVEPVRIRPPAPTRRATERLGLREVATVLIGTLLFGLAILLTPLTQVFGGMQLLAVMSGSMEPTIHVGGIVAVRPAQVSELQVGDVITFANQSSPDVLVTHRIVSLEARDSQTLVTTKGDANDSIDAVAVAATRAVGRVDFTLPWLGYLMVWLASPLAKAGILVIAIIGFALPSTKRKPEVDADSPAPRANAPTPIFAAPLSAQPQTATYAAFEREIEGLLPRAS